MFFKQAVLFKFGKTLFSVILFILLSSSLWALGTNDNTVWVSLSGNDTNDGLTQASAVKTINRGIQVAFNNLISDVKIIAGTYNENIILQAGINLYGGYSLGSTIQDPTNYVTTIAGVNNTNNVSTRPSGVDYFLIGSRSSILFTVRLGSSTST